MASRFGAPLILLLLIGIALKARRRAKKGGSLRYHVPVGQDPAAVITTLRQAGYEVTRDQAPTRIQDVVIACPEGVDIERERVRSVIARAPIDLGGAPAPAHQIVFEDEPGEARPVS
jgi:hypothetical protein